METLTRSLGEPLSYEFVQRALLGGTLVAVLCGVVGTWVVIRGMAFLGEALAHGMLPGVALATVLGWPAMIGGAVSAAAMSLGVAGLQRRGRLSYDTSIGLLFVAMLALGVIVISYSGSFATDATAILFGDILAIGRADLWLLAGACAVGLVGAALVHRPLVAVALDPRIAQVLGLRPRIAQAVLVGLVTLAVVASYQAVGSLLVVGLLLAPAVAAQHWTARIPTRMALAAVLGSLAVLVGLLVSWHAATAAGASVAAAAIGIALLSWVARSMLDALRRRRAAALMLTVALAASACSPGADDGRAGDDAAAGGAGHGAIEGAEEVSEPQLGITTVDPAGVVRHLDLLDESVVEIGEVGAPSAMTSDGRYLFMQTERGVEIVDSGRWTWDHVDHFHYYRAEPRLPGLVEGGGEASVATTNLSTASGTGLFFADSGEAVLLDNKSLSEGEVVEGFRLQVPAHRGLVVPVGSFALVTTGDGAVEGYTAEGEPIGVRETCAAPAGTITTRVGGVIGCRDGALLAHVADGELVIETIPYPADAPAPPATAFDNREGRPTAAALAGDEGIWLLDTRQRAWTLLPAPEPLAAVTAVDDADAHVLALTEEGRVLVIDGESGDVVARTEPLAPSSPDGPAPALIADQQRAYLSAPAQRRLIEIDYADDARVARTFDTSDEPAYTAETGR